MLAHQMGPPHHRLHTSAIWPQARKHIQLMAIMILITGCYTTTGFYIALLIIFIDSTLRLQSKVTLLHGSALMPLPQPDFFLHLKLSAAPRISQRDLMQSSQTAAAEAALPLVLHVIPAAAVPGGGPWSQGPSPCLHTCHVSITACRSPTTTSA